MRGFVLIGLGLVVAPLALAPAASSIRHDSACRPAGFAGTDSPDDWMLADQLSSFNCVGEMHPTAGGVWPDDHDWSWVPVPAGSTATFSVTICPTLVFVAGWNPDLSLSFLPAAGLVPATTPYVGQAAQYASPALSQVAAPLPIGASANASGCDAVLGASPPAGLDPGGGRYYVDVHRAAGGGAYTLVASLP